MSDKKKILLGAMVSEAEAETIQGQAAAENRSVSSYLRVAALERLNADIDETLDLLRDIRDRLAQMEDR